MRVLLYGLSANPPTGKHGHLGLIQHFASQFDQVWVLPVYQHIYASKSNLAPYVDRLAMCQLLFQQIPNVYVKEIEKDIAFTGSSPIGTFDIVSHLQQEFPDIEFQWLMGADTFTDLCQGKWKKGEELMKNIRFVVVYRPGMTFAEVSNANSGIATFHKIPAIQQVSSTAARSTKNEEDLRDLLDPVILSYIKQHHLYQFSPEDDV